MKQNIYNYGQGIHPQRCVASFAARFFADSPYAERTVFESVPITVLCEKFIAIFIKFLKTNSFYRATYVQVGASECANIFVSDTEN